MEKEPVTVQLVGKENSNYLIKFPNLNVPVKVNYNLYTKMKHSTAYKFLNAKTKRIKARTA